jgi:hypothetical protein
VKMVPMKVRIEKMRSNLHLKIANFDTKVLWTNWA